MRSGSGGFATRGQRHITRVLQSEGGRVEAAAARLVPRSTLHEKIRRHGIVPKI